MLVHGYMEAITKKAGAERNLQGDEGIPQERLEGCNPASYISQVFQTRGGEKWFEIVMSLGLCMLVWK